MEKKTYITQDDLDKFLLFLKSKSIWNYYLIVYNLAYSDKTYKELQISDISQIIIPEGIPHPNENPFLINICGVNTQLKIYQTFCGIRGLRFSTRLFRQKFFMDGQVFYGTLKKKRTSPTEFENCFIYILKHSHRDLRISQMFTDKKVGISTDMSKRTKLLTLGPVGIEVIKTWVTTPLKARMFEKRIHGKFKSRKIIGEWFSDENNDLIGIVENIISDLNYL